MKSGDSLFVVQLGESVTCVYVLAFQCIRVCVRAGVARDMAVYMFAAVAPLLGERSPSRLPARLAGLAPARGPRPHPALDDPPASERPLR